MNNSTWNPFFGRFSVRVDGPKTIHSNGINIWLLTYMAEANRWSKAITKIPNIKWLGILSNFYLFQKFSQTLLSANWTLYMDKIATADSSIR